MQKRYYVMDTLRIRNQGNWTPGVEQAIRPYMIGYKPLFLLHERWNDI